MENEDKYQYQLQRELNIRKVIVVSFIVVLMTLIIVICSLYIAEEDFRKWADVKILRKDISSEETPTIDLDVDKNNQIFCYSKYICILNEKNLKLYNTSGENISNISIEINTALFTSNNDYLAIAEKNGQEFCVLCDKTYLWKKKVDGEILQIYINKNGYVAIVTTDTTYKSIITVYDSSGNQLLKNYLSSTRVVDVTISNDNKHVAFAEMDTSGTLIQSNVKIISIEKAKINSEQAIEYSGENSISKMIVKIRYQEKGELICVYNDSVNIIKDGIEKNILPVDSDQITFVSGDLNNYLAYIKEEKKAMFNAKSMLYIVNPKNNQQNTFDFGEIAKEMYTYGNVIGINIGTDIYFVNTNGMLIKKFTSNQEVTNVMMSNQLAIVVYKDRVEIINL